MLDRFKKMHALYISTRPFDILFPVAVGMKVNEKTKMVAF
jgi:hypothetical protein